MTLPPADRYLASLAANSRHDSMLLTLASLSEMGYFVGLLVNGMTVYGRVTTDLAFAKHLDEEHARRVDRWKQNDPKWSDVEAKIKGSWARAIEEDERERRELIERNVDKGGFDELSDDDARATIEDRAPALTLADAKVIPAGAPPLDVPLLRVQVAQIGGWWLVPSNDDGNVSFTHPA